MTCELLRYDLIGDEGALKMNVESDVLNHVLVVVFM